MCSSVFNLGARLGWVVNATPPPLYRRERPGTHCYRRLGGSQGRSDLTYRDVSRFQRRIFHFIEIMSRENGNYHKSVLLRVPSGRPSVLSNSMVFPKALQQTFSRAYCKIRTVLH